MDNGGAFTDRIFALAGISPGADALDIGCGPGDVTLRLSRAVGSHGRVTGLDVNAQAVERARARASELGFKNTSFLEGDFLAFAQEGRKFDVITCRRVLMYLPEKPKAATAFIDLLKPNGVLILQEHDRTMRRAASDRPLSDQAQRWIWDTVQREGADLGTGFQLHSLLAEAGFVDFSVFAEAVVETPYQAIETAKMVHAMLPRIEAAQVATAADIDVDTLGDRLMMERSKSRETSITEVIFGVVARASPRRAPFAS